MLRSLLGGIVKQLRGRRQQTKTLPTRRRESQTISLMVETLEDRCLLSAATTVPSPISPLPFVGVADAVMASQPKTDSNIVFLGDSITYNFAYGPGAPIWAALMVGAGATDYGVPGQTTQNLLFQLALGQLSGVHTSVVVLTIGTNNLLQGDSPDATAAGILADVNAIHFFQPSAQVLVLGVPPGKTDPSDPYRNEVSQTDALVHQQLAGDMRATFFDIAPALEQANGVISNQILLDTIHPTTLGYADLTLSLFVPLSEAFLASASHTPHTEGSSPSTRNLPLL
jgi:lysophospholipase L1-like esterase